MSDEIYQALSVFALALLGYGVRLLRNFALEFIDKIKDEKMQSALRRVTDAAEVAVLATTQTYVDELRKHREDGVLTAEERSAAFNKAMEKAKASLGKEGAKQLTEHLKISEEELKIFLESKIEAAVAKQRKA